MEPLPELPEIQEDYPLEVRGGDPFQYSLEGIQPLQSVSEAQLSDTSLLFSQMPELAHEELPPLDPDSSPESEAPFQDFSNYQESTEAPIVPFDSLPFSADTSDSGDSQALSDIHSELKEMTKLLGQRQEKAQQSGPNQLTQKFSYRLPR